MKFGPSKNVTWALRGTWLRKDILSENLFELLHFRKNWEIWTYKLFSTFLLCILFIVLSLLSIRVKFSQNPPPTPSKKKKFSSKTIDLLINRAHWPAIKLKKCCLKNIKCFDYKNALFFKVESWNTITILNLWNIPGSDKVRVF